MAQLCNESKPMELLVIHWLPACASPDTTRFVVEAVPETDNAVVVAPPCPILKIVDEELLTASNRLSVPQVVNLLYGVVVPMPTLPVEATIKPSSIPSAVVQSEPTRTWRTRFP